MRLWRKNTLTFRLTWTLALAITLLLVGVAAIQVTLQDKFATECARTNGLSLSEGLFGALHQSMLYNDREGLRTKVRNIAAKSPNLRVRIYNKGGAIAFSSNDGEEGQRVDLQSVECVKCHGGNQPLERLPPGDRTREFTLDGHPSIGIIRPIENEPACYQAPCHAHEPERRLLGVLDVTLTMGPVERSRKWTAILTFLTAAFAVIATVGVVSGVVRSAVHAPLKRLMGTLDRLRAGDYKVRHQKEDIEEFVRLGASVNDAARDLESANAELVEWAQTLERRVDGKTEELRRAQQQMVQVERMASLGKLAAVVAHEINNPLASVVTYSRLLLKRAAHDTPGSLGTAENQEILEGISSESARCGQIVSNLLLFARRTGARMEPTDVHQLTKRVLFLLKHKMDLANVSAKVTLDESMVPVLCDPGQLEQALLALCVNGIEAMPDGGELTIDVRKEGDAGACLVVRDQGIGIPPDVLPRIYEPFFTSKNQGDGKGLGLGLSVVYGIVQHHRGTITVDSEQGQGTTFTMVFPGEPVEGELA